MTRIRTRIDRVGSLLNLFFTILFFICQENFIKNLLGKFHAEIVLLSTAWQCLVLLSTSGLVSGGARGAMAPPKF